MLGFTNELDLTVTTGFGGEESFIEVLLDRFDSRVDGAETLR